LLGLYLGFSAEVPEGKFTANVVVSALFVSPGVFLVYYCIMFFGKSTWARAQKKYAPNVNEGT
ncbi:MAG: hypothetical protein AAGF35_11570, partial [Pseudomonadota bacterium]